ncbi:MAG: glycosyltransferase family 1 protein [Chloroflexi bacterium]|nr:glycosyltransferase family 1 protein [Chloroflexota bacterium]
MQNPPLHPRIHHRPVPPVERVLPPSRLWGSLPLAVRAMAQRLLVATSPGAIWHSTYYTMPCRLGRWSRQGPVVTTVYDMIHERFPEYFPHDREFCRRKRRCIERADAVIAISQSTKHDMIEYLHIPESTVAVIYPAVSNAFTRTSPDEQDKLTQRYGLRKPFIMYLGPRSEYKNFRMLLRAYSLWRGKGDLDLVCIGGGAIWTKDEAELITRGNLDSSVRLIAAVNDEELRGFYSCAHAFVYPSLYEGFGIPPLEAMSCSTPVIACNTSSLPEVVGDAGLYFEPSAEEQLLDALDRIAEDTDLRQTLIRKGLERAGMFSWEKTAAATYNVYRNAL